MLVLTVGRGVHGFTLDRASASSSSPIRTCASRRRRSEFAINASNEPLLGAAGASATSPSASPGAAARAARDFNMRWIASLVAEVHRILIRGGAVHVSAATRKDPAKPGRLRLLYEANPMAMIVEQAGGARAPGAGACSRSSPSALHQRVPVILGSRDEVERIERYHRRARRGLDRPFESPLFHERSLFTQLSAAARAAPEHPGAPHVRQASDHRGHRLVRRGHHVGHAHLPVDLPPRGHQGRDRRGRLLPPLRPRGDEGEDGRGRAQGQPALQPLRPRGEPASRSSRRCSARTARRGRGRMRHYLHDDEEAAPFTQPPGTFTAWEDIPGGHRPALLRGPARRGRHRQGERRRSTPT